MQIARVLHALQQCLDGLQGLISASRIIHTDAGS